MYQKGLFNTHAPVIIGTNQVEGNLLNYFITTIPPTTPMSNATFTSFVNAAFGSMAPTVTSWYSTVRQQQGNWIALSEIYGDFLINCGSHFMANYISTLSQAEVFRYLFTHTPQNWPYNFLNATHSSEISFVFNDPAVNFMTSFTSDEQTLANSVASLWGSFVITSDPETLTGVNWPRYNKATASVINLTTTKYSLVEINWPICNNWENILLTGSVPF